jgi:hypothetical protein
MLTEQQKAIRKFEQWQQRKFTKNAKQGRYFFRPDMIGTPTPRSYRDFYCVDYYKDTAEKDERITDWIMGLLVASYIIFVILNELNYL